MVTPPAFSTAPLGFGGSIPVETRGPGSPPQRMDAPLLLTPRMGRVSADGDNQGMTLRDEGGDRKARTHLGAGRSPGGREHRAYVGRPHAPGQESAAEPLWHPLPPTPGPLNVLPCATSSPFLPHQQAFAGVLTPGRPLMGREERCTFTQSFRTARSVLEPCGREWGAGGERRTDRPTDRDGSEAALAAGGFLPRQQGALL